MTRRPSTFKKSGVPENPFRVTVDIFCPVPDCKWKKTVIRNGELGLSNGTTLPPFRKLFAEHWRTEHNSDMTLLAGVDMSPEGLERIRVQRELDALREF